MVRSRLAGAESRLRLSLHFESRRSTRAASRRSGANTASAMPCGGSWLKFSEAVPKAMSRSAITVGTPWLRAMDHARLCATVEAPMPPRTPKTEMVRPIGFTPRR